MTLTIDELRRIFPNAKQDYLDAIAAHKGDLEAAGVEGIRLTHWLAQGAAETGGFTIYEESGAYSAAGLLKTFPKYFKSASVAKAYAKRPQAIFNKTYGGRLGNTLPGDGFTYRGRGIFQITGKDAYIRYGERLGLDLVNKPELAAIPYNSVKIALLYWSDLKLNEWADRDDILAVSRGINGGNPKRNIQPNGMEHRKAWLAKIKLELGSDAPKAIPGTLKEGDQSQEVAKLQSLLRAKGYPAGAIDGIYGANTKRAVTLFQGDHSLGEAPGVWFADYWPTLEGAPNIQAERRDATASDLHRADDPAIKALTWSQRILLFLGFGGAITGGATEGASNFPALVNQYQPVIETLGPLFQWLATNGWLLVIVGAVALWFLARWAIGHIVKAYKHFDYQGPYKEVK